MYEVVYLKSNPKEASEAPTTHANNSCITAKMITSESETKKNSQPNKISLASKTHFGRQLKRKTTEMNLPKNSAKKKEKTRLMEESRGQNYDTETSKYFVENPLTNQSMFVKQVKVVLQRLKVDQIRRRTKPPKQDDGFRVRNQRNPCPQKNVSSAKNSLWQTIEKKSSGNQLTGPTYNFSTK
jgi:hypothetical protein